MDLETHRELYKPMITYCYIKDTNKELNKIEENGWIVYDIKYIHIEKGQVISIITHSKTAL